jgi:hypothetical protein
MSPLCPYHQYYIWQAGNGIGGAIYKRSVNQRGHGLGSFLKGLFRTVAPLFKSGVKILGREALKTGSYILSDIVNDRPAKEAVRTHVGESFENLKRKVGEKVNNLTGSGNMKRRRIQNKNHKVAVSRKKKKSHKKRSADIFE